MLISKLLIKLQKDSCEKSDQRKSDRIMEFLPFITLCKSFQPIFSFLASNFAFYDTQIEFLQHIFLAYIRIQLYIHFRPGRLHFDKKKSKSLYPNAQVFRYDKHRDFAPFIHILVLSRRSSVWVRVKICFWSCEEEQFLVIPLIHFDPVRQTLKRPAYRLY